MTPLRGVGELATLSRSFNTMAERLKTTQEQLVQKEKLASVGQLAAGIAHDFNNIMAVISLYAGMSLRIADLPEKIYERLETIDQQAHRASDLIQQILDFGRRAVLERLPMELGMFLKELAKLLGRTLPENIKIDLVIDSDEYTVNADLTRVQQMIMNLATNAFMVFYKGELYDLEAFQTRVIGRGVAFDHHRQGQFGSSRLDRRNQVHGSGDHRAGRRRDASLAGHPADRSLSRGPRHGKRAGDAAAQVSGGPGVVPHRRHDLRREPGTRLRRDDQPLRRHRKVDKRL